VLQGVIAGIGLIAMGGVMHKDDRVRGATTGASVWVVGSIGAACGLGLYVQAAAATAIAAFILIVLGVLERFVERRARSRHDK
jgi:putative Mg2+ transporter-C (MgtC) family protein